MSPGFPHRNATLDPWTHIFATGRMRGTEVGNEAGVAVDMTTEKGSRPRYFVERISVEGAMVWIDAHIHTLGQEEISLDNAVGRVIAADVTAAIDVPHFDRAAADGYALRA